MKKKISLVTAALCFTICIGHAQENKVVSAKMHLDEYSQDPKDSAALQDAKDAIDLAATNDKTKDEPKMWLYRGFVYRTAFERKLNLEKQKFLPKGTKPTAQDVIKASAQAYATADTNLICVAAYSFMRVIQLEPTKSYADDARGLLPNCSGYIENIARTNFSLQKYAVALAMFQRAMALGYAEGMKDTAAFMVLNIQNIAITADRLHNNNIAIANYTKLIDLKADTSQPYLSLIRIYSDTTGKVDTAKANDMLRKGRQAYPKDLNLLIAETNYDLHNNKTDLAISNLQKTIDRLSALNNPANAALISQLYFVMGNTYDRMANPKDNSGKALPLPANYEDLFSKAGDNYAKAVALTPDNFDEEYDLGALYNNRASALNREADEVPPTDKTGKYDKLSAMAKDYLKKAQPYLEKAHSITPADQGTIHALMQIYASTGQTDKVQALKDGK